MGGETRAIQSLPCFEISATDILKGGGRRVRDGDEFLSRLNFVAVFSECVIRCNLKKKKVGERE